MFELVVWICAIHPEPVLDCTSDNFRSLCNDDVVFVRSLHVPVLAEEQQERRDKHEAKGNPVSPRKSIMLLDVHCPKPRKRTNIADPEVEAVNILQRQLMVRDDLLSRRKCSDLRLGRRVLIGDEGCHDRFEAT